PPPPRYVSENQLIASLFIHKSLKANRQGTTVATLIFVALALIVRSVTYRTAASLKFSAILLNFSAILQRHFAMLQRLSATLQRHFAMLQKFSATLQRHFAMLQKFSAMLQKHFAMLQKSPAVLLKPAFLFTYTYYQSFKN
ncbi:MAG: hypothetical protein LBC40_09475, partial [Dysgonamonadaceae bacterium]|nr:hypothetical protein [Dysgonamonadaceae bacterium]